MKSIGFTAVFSLGVSLFFMIIFSVIFLLIQLPRIEWLSFLSNDLKPLAGVASGIFLFIALYLSGTMLYGYLLPPYSIVMTNERIQFSIRERSFDIAFDDLIGVEQLFKIKLGGLYWLREYRLYISDQIIKLPMRNIESHYKLEDRLFECNERQNKRRVEALQATAKLETGKDTSLSSETRLTIAYRRLKAGLIVADFENRIILSGKKQLSADQIRSITVDCKVSRENGGGREIRFELRNGKNCTVKTKNYAFSDEEWFSLLQNLYIAAWRLNIPIDVEIPRNRPLHLFPIIDEKERAS